MMPYNINNFDFDVFEMLTYSPLQPHTIWHIDLRPNIQSCAVVINIRWHDSDILFGIHFEEGIFICIVHGRKYIFDCQINKDHSTKKLVTTMLTYPWKCTLFHCNHLGNTWKPLVLMTRHFDYCPSAS